MFKHIGSNWTQSLLQMAVMMVLTPFMIRELGETSYGLWIAILALTGYLQLLVLGVPMAAVRHIADFAGRRDLEGANRAIATSLRLCLWLGLGALAIGTLLYPFFDRALIAGEGGAAPEPGAITAGRLAYVLVVVQVASGFAMRLPYAVFDAFHEFPLRNAIMSAGLLLRLGLVLWLLSVWPSIVALAAVVLAQAALEFLACLWFIRRRHPQVRFSGAAFDRALVGSIFGFSMYATLLNFGSQLAYRTDAIVIGAFLDPVAITDFDIANKFFDPLTTFMLGIGMVVMPTAAKLKSSGRLEELRPVFLRWSKIALVISLFVGLYLCVLGPTFLAWWVEPRYEAASGPTLQVLMLSFVVFLPVRAVAVPVLLGAGRPRAPALGVLVMGVVNLALSLLLVKPMGILGVAIGTALPNVFFAAWVLRLACREIGTSVSHFLLHVAGRALLGSLPALALLLWLKLGLEVSGFWPLLLGGIALTLLFGACAGLYVFRGDPHLDLCARLVRDRGGVAR